MPKASVIVPVYKVKDYLEPCVRSILAQTERDFELLLIDDGSPDECGAMCDAFAQSDPRIRVIHQENRGLGGARNTGIEAAVGDWLLFVDSDDWIDPETLQTALAAGETTGAQLVVFGFRTVDGQGKTLGVFQESLPMGTAFSPKERKDAFLIFPCAWNKLYRRELFTETEIRYPSRVWYEDIRTTLKLLTQVEQMVCIDSVCYNYLQREGSIMNSGNLQRNREIIDAFDDLLPWFSERGLLEEYRDELGYLAATHVYLTASVRVLRSEQADKPLVRRELLPAFRAYVQEKFPDYEKNPYLSRLPKGQKLLWRLLKLRCYAAIKLLFSLKGALS